MRGAHALAARQVLLAPAAAERPRAARWAIHVRLSRAGNRDQHPEARRWGAERGLERRPFGGRELSATRCGATSSPDRSSPPRSTPGSPRARVSDSSATSAAFGASLFRLKLVRLRTTCRCHAVWQAQQFRKRLAPGRKPKVAAALLAD